MTEIKKQRGGARAGAGRKPKAELFATAIAKAEKKIADRLPAIIDAQFDLALGVSVQEIDRETGAAIVYVRPPDARAGQYLIDRILGKPTERKEVSGVDGGPIPVEVFDYNTAIAPLTHGSGDDSDASGEDTSA